MYFVLILFLQLMCELKFFFFSETEKAIFEAILEGKLDLQRPPWPSISASAKDLIKQMLTINPTKRITAAAALG